MVDYTVVEKKVLFALMDLADSNNMVTVTSTKLAHHIGYKKSGGAITWAIRLLKERGKIKQLGKRTYKVLV